MLGLKETINGLAKMVDLAAETGVDGLILQSNLTGWGKDDWRAKNLDLQADYQNQNTKNLIKEARAKAKKNKIKFLVNYKYTIFKKDKKEKCNWPWGGAYVATDGSVVPCCLIADPTVFSSGNVFSENFSRLWNNEKYRKLRKDIRKGNIPFFCRDCYFKQ